MVDLKRQLWFSGPISGLKDFTITKDNHIFGNFEGGQAPSLHFIGPLVIDAQVIIDFDVQKEILKGELGLTYPPDVSNLVIPAGWEFAYLRGPFTRGWSLNIQVRDIFAGDKIDINRGKSIQLPVDFKQIMSVPTPPPQQPPITIPKQPPQQPPITIPKQPPQQPTRELFEFHIKTSGINPNLPTFVVDKLRAAMQKAGYGLNNIYADGQGYVLQVEKLGSIPIVLLIGLLKWALALVGVIVTALTFKRLSDNKVILERQEDVSTAVNDVLDYAKSVGASPQETQELLEQVKNVYQSGAPIQPSPSPSGFLDNFNKFGNVFLGIALIAALSNIARRN